MDRVSVLPRLEAEVRRIGASQLAGYRALRPEDVSVKTDAGGETSSVTRHDTESEAELHDWLHREFPQHSFLGEESGNTRRDPAHYWILDPIDGTSNFTKGIPFWGVSLAYWRDRQPQLAVLYFPALDRMYTAWKDGGAFLNGVRIRTSEAHEYSMLNSVALESRSHLRYTLHLRTKVRILGSAIANLCYTAQGSFVACRVRGRLWDVAAGELLLREAGAVIDAEPDLRGIDPAASAFEDGLATRFTFDARANAHLPPLAEFLRPAPPLS